LKLSTSIRSIRPRAARGGETATSAGMEPGGVRLGARAASRQRRHRRQDDFLYLRIKRS
jgi:hypothetical protein